MVNDRWQEPENPDTHREFEKMAHKETMFPSVIVHRKENTFIL